MHRAVAAALLLLTACTGAAPARRATGPSVGSIPSPARVEQTSAPRATTADRPELDAWLLWTLGGIPPGLRETVRSLGEIRDVAQVASGTTWLLASGDEPVRGDESRFAIPFEVAAVRKGEYARFLPPRAARAVRGLGQLDAVLGSTGAALLDVEVGGIALREGNLSARGVLADGLIGEHEALVSMPTGRSLGVNAVRYLLVEPEEGVPPDRMHRALMSAVPPGVPARVRAPGSTAYVRHADLTLPQSRLKALFGEFAAAPAGGWFEVERSWVRRNIVEARVPILGRVTCHRRIVPLVRGALRELVRRGLGRLVDPAQYGGCYAPRFIGRDPGAGLSHHAWGVAIDINVADNPLGAEPTMDRRVVRSFERWGFVWGGDFIRPDGHHFEFRCFPSRCAEPH
ncbi:MAG TPA: M15 family metallopeptidase [Actinomycetota bacterium]|nr:M15 family metallopeptidase [Actinomycetota bacterium]